MHGVPVVGLYFPLSLLMVMMMDDGGLECWNVERNKKKKMECYKIS